MFTMLMLKYVDRGILVRIVRKGHLFDINSKIPMANISCIFGSKLKVIKLKLLCEIDYLVRAKKHLKISPWPFISD